MEEVQKKIIVFVAVPEEAGGFVFWGEVPGGWKALFVGTAGEILPYLDTQTVFQKGTEYVLVTIGSRGGCDYSAGYSTEAALASNAAAARWVKFKDEARVPTQKKIIVFIAVPRGPDAFVFWCEHEGKWGPVYNGPPSAAHAIYLKRSTERLKGTESVVLFLTSDSLAAGVRRIEYSAGHSGQAATAAEGAYDRWVGHRRAAKPDDIPRVAQAATPEPAPEQKKEPEKELELCSFCQTPAIAGNSILSTCNQHAHALTLHAARMAAGLIDCPETRAETLRFDARSEAEAALSLARSTGFRTVSDRTMQESRTSITDRLPPTEPVPLVGTTPHYEWP